MESSNSVTRQSFSKPMARRGKGKQIYQVGLVGLDFYLLSSPTRLFISQATKGERQEQQAVVQEISSSDSSYKHTRSYILYNVSVSWTCAKKKKYKSQLSQMKSLEYQELSARKTFSTVTFIRIFFAFEEQVPRLAGNSDSNI